MNELFIQVVGGVLVIVIASLFGFGGGSTHVVVGGKVKKTGKWIIIISVVMILIGASMNGEKGINPNELTAGTLIMIYGVIFFFVGKFVAWFQRP
jgi:hypothetical protein